MFQHENLKKDQEIKVSVSAEDVIQSRNALSLEDGPVQNKSKEESDRKDNSLEKGWLKNRLKKMEEKKEDDTRLKEETIAYLQDHTVNAHTQRLHDILVSSGRGKREKRKLVYFPQKSALITGYSKTRRNMLQPQTRVLKKHDRSSELYQKEQNAKMIEGAGTSFYKNSLTAMEKLMEKREIKCDDREVYSDLTAFIGSTESTFTSQDKKDLLNFYLGKSTKKGPEGPEGREGQDTQKALDLMTKALFAIDIPSIRLDSDTYIAQNAAKLESVVARVNAYERMLRRYEKTDDEGNVKTYFDDIDEKVGSIVKNQLKRLQNLSLFYLSRRDVITNKYYRSHYNEEISMNVTGADNQQKALSKNMMESVIAGRMLMASYNQNQQDIDKTVGNLAFDDQATEQLSQQVRDSFANSQELKELQRQKMEEALNRMDYFAVNGEGVYVTRSDKSSSLFKYLIGSFNGVVDNIRFFETSSFQMKLVRKHVGFVLDMLNKPLSEIGVENVRFELMYAFLNLVNSCKDYQKDRITGNEISKRQQNILDVLDSASGCFKFLYAMTDSDFAQMSQGDQNQPLSKIFMKSDHRVSQTKEERVRSQKEFLRMLHYNYARAEIHESFSGVERLNSFIGSFADIDTIYNQKAPDNEEDFNDVKNQLLEEYTIMQNLGLSYTKNGTSSFASKMERYDKVRQTTEYAKEMLNLLKNISFAQIKDRNIANLKWSDIVFGEEMYTMYEEGAKRISGDNTKKSASQKFTDKESDHKKYNYGRAFSFIGGDNTMCVNYKPTRMHYRNGKTKMGLSHRGIEDKIEGHVAVVRYATASKILEEARNNHLNIVYSETALRQLSNIRVMDTLFGKKRRDLDKLVYNAATQVVFGEVRIVIRGVVCRDFSGYAGSGEADEQEGPKVKDTSVLDDEGKLKIRVYDRKVANRIMSQTAEEGLKEFERLGMVLSQDEKEGFKQRYNKLKSAFEQDLKNEHSWRSEQDKKDAKDREESIKDCRNNLKKFRRWKLADDNAVVADVKKQIRDLKKTGVKDPAGLYTSDFRQLQENGDDLGLIEPSFVEKLTYIEKERTAEEEKKEQDEILSREGVDLEKKQREFAARNKILEIRKATGKYVSVSDKRRIDDKKKIKNMVAVYLTDENPKEATEKFRELMEVMNEYADLDVTVSKCIKDSVFYEGNVPVFLSEDFKKEALLVNRIKKMVKEILAQIPADTKDMLLLREKKNLEKIQKRFEEMTGGGLPKISEDNPNHRVYKDDRFADINYDKIENKITKIKKYEMVNKKDVPLFAHEPCVGDIAQGNVGDCYVLAALASIVEKTPNVIKRMMRDNDDGTVTVRFYRGTTPVFITVEKTVPRNTKSENENLGGDLFAKGALWVQMIEKAYAASGMVVDVLNLDAADANNEFKDRMKIMNDIKAMNMVSYTTIASGDAHAFSEIVTGVKADMKKWSAENEFEKQLDKGKIKYTSEQLLFIDKATNIKNGVNYTIMSGSMGSFDAGDGTGLEATDLANGVYNRHAYSVLGIEEIAGEKNVVLRNPWGTGGTDVYYNKETGAISTRHTKSFSEGGILFVPLDTYFRLFRGFHIAKY